MGPSLGVFTTQIATTRHELAPHPQATRVRANLPWKGGYEVRARAKMHAMVSRLRDVAVACGLLASYLYVFPPPLDYAAQTSAI